MERATTADREYRKGTSVMTSSKRWTAARAVAAGLAAGMFLLMSGDRGGLAATPPGIDPLEILNLQIRANAIVILDSSGSMAETLAPSAGDLAGDDPNSKLYQAKAVLTQVIRDNERKVSFQFGQYEQPGVGAQAGEMAVPTVEASTYDPGNASGGAVLSTERFLYSTTSARTANLVTNELTVDLRSYIVPNNARIYLIENGTSNVNAPVAAGLYPTGTALALALSTAASNAGTGGNAYTVTYMDNHRFRFRRTTGTQSFTLRWSQMGTGDNLTLRNLIGGSTTDQAAAGTPPEATTANDSRGAIDLRRRSDTEFVESGVTFYKLFARRFFNGQRLVLRQSSNATSAAPTAAPASLGNGDVVCSVTPAIGTTGVGGTGQLAVATDPFSARDQPWVELVRGDASCNAAAGAQASRFYFSSVPRGNYAASPAAGQPEYIPGGGEWRRLDTGPNPDVWIPWGADNTCGGFESLVSLQPCTNNAQFNLIAPHLKLEVEIDPVTRLPIGYTENTDGSITPPTEPTVQGIRAGGSTPISESIADVDAEFTSTLWPTISAYGANGPFPKTFLIFLTDGDDTCQTADGGTSIGDDNMALRAAYRAQLLRQSIDTSTPRRAEASSISTFVIAFGSGASATRSNWISYGGSGMIGGGGAGQIPLVNHGGAIGQAWSRGPTAAELATCTTCRPASIATNPAELAAALQSAIEQGQTVGVFSDQQSVTESIFELAYRAQANLDPFESNRYDFSVPILLQSTFEMPSFEGRLKAFRRQGNASVQEWDAGQKLQDRVAAEVGVLPRTWTELRGTGTTDDVLSTDALIERRIYTTSGNGVYGVTVADLLDNFATPPARLTLWPTEASIDPVPVSNSYPAGKLDIALGISPGLMSFSELQATFGACTASTVGGALPADCTAASGRAVQEARRAILAYTAGAELLRDGAGAIRTSAGEIQFRLRNWILAESTLAAPAAVGPPPDERTKFHVAEYQNFIKGPSGDALKMGFGLTEPPDATDETTADSTHQPVMSVVYHAANDMLHAFRAGPCNKEQACVGTSLIETGGEELWGFVPYDLLGALKGRLQPQGRTNHTYMLSAPVRLADVFVPGSFSRTVEGTTISSNEGVWRVMIFLGRGIGGKYVTALDVTAPGQFNLHSLKTTGPIPIWNRGNPDTHDGQVGGVANNSLEPNDLAAYAEMGQTWSIPAIGFVRRAGNVTTRTPGGVEYAAYMGSGYANNAGCTSGCEGARFYALDALTGDVIASHNVGNRNNAATPFTNVIAAGPAVFQPERVSFRPQGGINESILEANAVYFNDIHGRVWKTLTNNPGNAPLMLADVNGTGVTQHPLGVSPALLNYEDPLSQGGNGMERPHLYVESGNDNRIFLPTDPVPTTPPFKAWGLIDRNPDDSNDAGGDGVTGPVKVLFAKDFPALYRGTTQAATAFESVGLGRVFIAGTRFNPPGTTNAPPPPPCRSSFDSILFALGAASGNAAFDLNSGNDEYVEYRDEKVMSVQAVRGHVVVDRGLGAEIAPTPPPAVLISQPVPGSVFNGISIPENYAIANRETPFRAQPTLCR
jgi:hypothetical protein